jgi:hypothetical protein
MVFSGYGTYITAMLKSCFHHETIDVYALTLVVIVGGAV